MALHTPAKSGSRWWVWGLLLLALAAYFALRST
jgi:MYXO-CTERM domain-containing protein